jgi:hypothetical protein
MRIGTISQIFVKVAPTLIVIKSEYGKRFGGYISQQWDEDEKGDKFIFSFDNSAKFLNTDFDCGLVVLSDYFGMI